MQPARRAPRMSGSGLTLWILLALGAAQGAGAAELWIGGATTSITPQGPVAVSGEKRGRESFILIERA